MLANALSHKNEVKTKNHAVITKDTLSIQSMPIDVLNHPMVRASMNFMEKLNTIHRESLLSSTYSMTQTDALLKHFVSQSQDTSPQQCKAAQIILNGWAKMMWQQMSEDTIEKIRSIVNYCLQFPQDHAPLLIIAYRCLNDFVVDQSHPLAPMLNDVVFVLEQQGLLSSSPSFALEQPQPEFSINDCDWSGQVLKLASCGIVILSISQMWLDSTWQLLLT
ncbi:MAG: hypothetical protein VX835_04510 [Pseudomonadota bacterium]|nr:hypothetical protein [Pseudomonadota bacterium]